MAPIAVGDKIPDGNLSFMNEQGLFETVSIHSLVTGKKVFVAGIPGAFMPDCRWWYTAPAIQTIFESTSNEETLFISVNDPNVVWGWKLAYFPRNVPHVRFLADSKGAYFTALGLDRDLTSGGFGVRSRMFLMLVEDREVVQFTGFPMEYDPPSFFERPTPTVSRAPIAVGDIIPDGTLTFINEQGQMELVSMHSIVSDKRVLVLGVRGAFLPRCSKHLVATFIDNRYDFEWNRVEQILCISVNDPFVMRGWKLACFKDDKSINFLADSTAAYVTSLGLADDLSHMEYGIRSRRFALLLEDRKVMVVKIQRAEEDVPTAEAMLESMN